MNEQQRRVIHQNRNLPIKKLSNLLSLPFGEVRGELGRVGRNWSYSGAGLPFCRFQISPLGYCVYYKNKRVATCCFSTAMQIIDHLIWCIENDMFNQPRIEHPYFDKLEINKWQHTKLN